MFSDYLLWLLCESCSEITVVFAFVRFCLIPRAGMQEGNPFSVFFSAFGTELTLKAHKFGRHVSGIGSFSTGSSHATIIFLLLAQILSCTLAGFASPLCHYMCGNDDMHTCCGCFSLAGHTVTYEQDCPNNIISACTAFLRSNG
jgi:hypothetical protein